MPPSGCAGTARFLAGANRSFDGSFLMAHASPPRAASSRSFDCCDAATSRAAGARRDVDQGPTSSASRPIRPRTSSLLMAGCAVHGRRMAGAGQCRTRQRSVTSVTASPVAGAKRGRDDLAPPRLLLSLAFLWLPLCRPPSTIPLSHRRTREAPRDAEKTYPTRERHPRWMHRIALRHAPASLDPRPPAEEA